MLQSPERPLAVRIRGLGKYFGSPVEMDGPNRPREAWQSLLRIAGFNVRVPPEDAVQGTVATRGHVLRDISLDIEQGSVVCLTGSGESASVLLQILDRVASPTAGSVEIHGSVTSLLTVGGNLDARLTAHENIQASRRFRKAPPDEAVRYAAEVIAFAGLEGFEHVPLRTYSTGMTLRLSVGLALCTHASIVLIDDVLSVGDIAFQQRCVDRVLGLKEAGRTLILSFSDEALVRQVATRIIAIEDGSIVLDTVPTTWATTPRTASSAANVEWEVLQNLPEDEAVALRNVSVAAASDDNESYLDLSFVFDLKRGSLKCRPSVFLMKGRTVVFRSLFPQYVLHQEPGRCAFSVRVPTHTLSNGNYGITVSMIAFHEGMTYSLKAPNVVAMKIRRGVEDGAATASTPVLVMTTPWEIEMLTQDGAP